MAYINTILEVFKEERYRNSFSCNKFGEGFKISIPKRIIINKFNGIEDNLKDYFTNPEKEILSFKEDFVNVLSEAKSLSNHDKKELKETYEQPVFLNHINGEFPPLFSYANNSIRISFSGSDRIFDNSRFLYWCLHANGDPTELIELEIGAKHRFTEPLEIGFGDDIIKEFNSERLENIGNKLVNDFVFKSDTGHIIFIETFLANSNHSFRIHGLEKRIDIVIKNSKWVIRRIQNIRFSKKSEFLKQLNVVIHPKISFVEVSEAKEAYETIKAEEAKGNTLISLWQTYSAIELERANQLKEKIGDFTFYRTQFIPEGITIIRINNLTEDLKASIKENKDDLLNTSFELSTEKEEENETKVTDNKRFFIKSIRNDFSLELYDELSSIPEKGTFTISLIGDEIVNKRRNRALKSLREDRRFITQNLLFAIENKADAMLTRKRKEKPITDRTKKFLKDKFGIADLTPNQKEAVEIAINTPDIAIVQGPPGTGKSTVVAAICDRLIEIAEKHEKNKEEQNSKTILVSAFQNDTVEHIASKIYTLGLPTIKIGKETQSNVRAEDKFIEEIKSHIDNSLQRLSLKSTAHRLSKKLSDIKSVYLSEKDEQKLKQDIDSVIGNSEFTDELWHEWKEINGDRKFNETSTEKNLSLLKGLRTEQEAYNDDGFYKIQRLLKSDLPISETEKKFLESCPIDTPDDSILKRLGEIQEAYLEQLNNSANNISTGNNISILDWLEKAKLYFQQKEETLYEDEETFLAANLEALRDELDGNADYIRNSIKNYGESLAATNQVAGGKEMSSYSKIENVILEEAARSNPLDLLIPMSKATDRIIMVGDQNQLPHLLEDDIADETSTKLSDRFIAADTRKKLEESLFGVIFKNLHSANPRRTITLTEQFRMHPFIGDFISKVYYKNELKAGHPNQADHKRHQLELPWAKNKVAVFCDVKKNAGLEQSGKSKSRNAESQRLIKLLDELKTDANFENLSIGIITFYAKQVDDIFKAAAKRGYAELRADGNYEIALQYRETPDGREKLRIGSVDSFQGKEFDIVILSTVRSNTITRNHDNFKKVFGFLTLENRLNVAFSRAQKLLIVVGDSEMFLDEFAQTYVEGLYKFYNNLSTDSNYGNRI